MQNFTIDDFNTAYQSNLTNLEQFTQYAYYVKTQVVYKDHENDTLNVVQGQSNIRYFRTKPDVPTAPIVETASKTNSSITIEWYPAVTKKELIEYYKVDVFIQPDDHRVLDSRNYCLHPREDRQSSIGVEMTSQSAVNVSNCAVKPLPVNWESATDWAIDQRIECYREHEEDNDRRSEISKLLNSRKQFVCEWNDENCPFEFVENDNNIRFTRSVHDFVRKQDIDERQNYEVVFEPVANEDEVIPEIRKNSNFLFTKRFHQLESNSTIEHLKPFTLYTMHFFSCNHVDCSSYYMHNERTEPSMNADDMDFEISVDPSASHTVHLDFSEPKTPNGLTVAFIVNIHDLAKMNYTKKCITRKNHYENNKRYTISNLQKGIYNFSVSSISLAMNGPSTPFKSITVYETMSVAVIIAILIASVILIGVCIVLAFIAWSKLNERRRIVALAGSRMNILMSDDLQGSHFNVCKFDDDLFDIAEDNF